MTTVHSSDYDFLKNIEVSDEVRNKLVYFGAPSPLALVCIARAAPEAFKAYLGSETETVIDKIQGLLTASDLRILEQDFSQPALGALLSPAPSVQSNLQPSL